MNCKSIFSLAVNQIHCESLPNHDKRRIEEVGFWRWLDEVVDQPSAGYQHSVSEDELEQRRAAWHARAQKLLAAERWSPAKKARWSKMQCEAWEREWLAKTETSELIRPPQNHSWNPHKQRGREGEKRESEATPLGTSFVSPEGSFVAVSAPSARKGGRPRKYEDSTARYKAYRAKLRAKRKAAA